MKYKTDIEFPNEVWQMKKSTSHHLEIVRKGFLCCPSSKSWYFLCLNGKLEIITYRGSILLKKKKRNNYQNEDTETNILLPSWRQSTGGSCIVRNRHTVTFRL